jgi:hypothetical protein
VKYARAYSPDEIKLFAQYRDQRALAQPLACVGGEGCWVEVGPPSLTAKHDGGGCRKCRGFPRPLPLGKLGPVA